MRGASRLEVCGTVELEVVPRISLIVAEWKRGAEGRRVARSDGNDRGLRRSGDKEGCGHEHREDEKREDFHASIVASWNRAGKI